MDLDSLPALSGGAPVRSEDLTLEASDGTLLAAFAAIPDEAGTVGIAVLPDVRGLYRFYDGAPNSFFDRKFVEHAAASADAWKRVLAFIAQHATALS